MRLRKSAGNELEFKKKLEKEIHHFSFRRFIDFVIEQSQKDKEDDNLSNESIDSESDENSEESFQNDSQ